MVRESPAHTPLGRRVLAAAVPFALAALLVLLFDVVREIPASYTCGAVAPDGHDAVVADYRAGAVPLHLLTVGITLGALVLLSAGRGRGPFGVGWPTLIAAALAVSAALVALLANDEAAVWVLLPLLLVVIGIAVVAGTFGAQATAAVAALLLAGAAAWTARAVARGRTAVVRTALWALVVLTAAHLLLVGVQGDVPGFC